MFRKNKVSNTLQQGLILTLVNALTNNNKYCNVFLNLC